MLQVLLTIYLLLLLSLNSVQGLFGKQCDIYDLRTNQCDQFEICDEKTNSCQCLPGYKKEGTFCKLDREIQKPEGNSVSSPNSSSLVNEQIGRSSIVTGFLLPFFILVSLVGGIYLSKKYDLIYWVRNKIYSIRRTNYDEFMIGQDVDDDPPLR